MFLKKSKKLKIKIVKSYYAVLLLTFIWSCGSDNNKSIPIVGKDSFVKTIDSLQGRRIDLYPSLQEDIMLDTPHFKPSIHHMGIRVIMPVVSKNDHPWVWKQLDSIRRYSVSVFLEMVKEDTVHIDSVFEWGSSMWIEPKSLYKSDSLISFILENGHRSMTSSFMFNTINFDCRMNRRIEFGDYFLLDTPADSISLSSIISRAGYKKDSLEAKRYWDFYGPMDFGFDKENVYFCFEKFSVSGWGAFSIRKKFLIDHIWQRYR